jgi:hypothetical protein
MGGGGGMALWGSGGGCASSLLQFLSQWGFLLIDCVKKDELYGKASSPPSIGIAAMGKGIGHAGDRRVGPVPQYFVFWVRWQQKQHLIKFGTTCHHDHQRFLLYYLFCQSLLFPSRFSSSLLYSLSSTSSHHNNLKWKLAQLDAEDANDNECVPPSPTPM